MTTSTLEPRTNGHRLPQVKDEQTPTLSKSELALQYVEAEQQATAAMRRARELEKQLEKLESESDRNGTSSAQLPAPKPRSGPDNDEPEIHDLVHEAFDAISMGCVCTLADLLTETRRRGLSDSDVKEVIQDDELNLSFKLGDEHQFRCCRTSRGVAYIERDNGSTDGVTLASAAELFAELEAGDNVEKESRESGYSLSEELREAGHQLSDIEALILDVAQVTHRDFKRGVAVSFRVVKRILRRYHWSLVGGVDLSAAAVKLTKDGILEKTHSTIRLIVPGFVKGRKPSVPLKVQQLVSDPMQRRFLQACNDCCGVGFNNGNVAARAAVWSLMHSRHNVSRQQFSNVVCELTAAKIITEVNSKGSTAFRLLPSAIATLSPHRKAEAVSPVPMIAGTFTIHVGQ